MIAIVRRAFAIVEPGPKRRLRWMLPLGMGLAALEIAALALLIPFIDTLVSGEEQSWLLDGVASAVGAETRNEVLLATGVSIAGLLLIKSFASMMYYWWQFGVLTSAEADMATSLVRRYLDASVAFHAQHNTAHAIQNINGAVNGLFRQILIPAMTAVIACVGMTAVFVVLMIASPLTVLVLIAAFSVLAAGFAFGIARPARHLGHESYTLNVEAIRQMLEGITGIKIIQASNRQGPIIARFADLRARWRPVRRRVSFLTAVARYYLEIGFILGVGALVAVLAVFGSGAEALSGLAVVTIAAFTLLPAVGRVLGQVSAIRVGEIAVTRLEGALADLEDDRRVNEPRLNLAEEAVPADARSDQFRRSIRFDGVGVTHRDGRVALRRIDLEMAKGETIGVVGRSGAGKTTLVDVLLGLTEPTEGSLVVDGRALRPADWPWWRAQVGYVPQDVFLLDDSLRANVTLAEPEAEADQRRLARALRQAQLDGVIAQLPEGLDTRLGERGLRLSGGQRQRLGLARALYREPTILVLDEATSALDIATERGVQRVLANLGDDLTMVIVAHRLNTVRSCDRIVVLDHGSIESIGSFDELRTSSELFSELMTLETKQQTEDSPLRMVGPGSNAAPTRPS